MFISDVQLLAQALNGCEGIRVGLILDIWHPELTDDEILHITHLLARFEQETGIQAKAE
jgi:hypothetical protein